MAARDDPEARRRGRPGRSDPHAPEDVGGLRPPGGLQRSARAVPWRVQAALPRRPPARGPARRELRCPVCGGELSEPREFNLMFQTQMGPVVDEGSTIYL